jgi:hypothetical protein
MLYMHFSYCSTCFITWSCHDCLILIIVPYYSQLVLLSSYANARSRSHGAGVRDPKEQVHEVLVVHKRQVIKMLTWFVIKTNPGASHHNPWLLFESLSLCWVWLCMRLVVIAWNRSCIKTTFLIILDYFVNSCKPLANGRRSCKIRYRSGGMEATRLLGCYSLNLLEAYIEIC